MRLEALILRRVAAHCQDAPYTKVAIAVENGRNVVRAEPEAGEVGNDLLFLLLHQLLDQLARTVTR